MPHTFTSEFFKNNRQKLRDLHKGSDLIVIAANGLLQRGADTTFPFCQDANFWYLTGINEPDLLLIMDGDKEYMIVPERSVSRQAFDGSITDDSIRQTSGIAQVYEETEGWENLNSKIKKQKRLGVLGAPASYQKDHGLYANPARARLIRRLHKIEPEVKTDLLNDYLRDLRAIKQPLELAAIQKAIDITVDSLKESLTKEKLGGYQFEYELEANITRGLRSRGAAGHAYEPIVASGARACTLHYIENNSKIDKSELVVIDVGAEVDHYAADITRTVAMGAPSKRQKEVYAKVLEVQEFACSLLKPGVLLRDYEKAVREFLGEKLIELGLIKEINFESTLKYYPHSTSHFLGLNVHDVGNYEEPLRAGMVMTVEPGIYIPEEGIGIRIEDDVLITDNGIQVLSSKIPKKSLTI